MDEKQSLPNKRQLASTTDLEAIEKSPAALRPPPYPEPIPVAGGERSDVSAERRPSEEHVIKLSRRTAWVTVVGLILLIGGLVGGLAGGLISKYSHGGESTPSSTTHQSSGISTPTTAITTSTSTFSESTFTTAVAPSPYPSILSSKNLVQNALFEKGFEYWSDQQDCWQTTYDPSGTEDDVEMIARVYNNDANPGSPCPLTQTILTAGSGKFSLSFLYGTYFDNAADAADAGGGVLTVRAGGKSAPAILLNATYSVPGRYYGFPIASFDIISYESDFLVEFSGWSNASVWDIGKVQLIRV